MITRHKDKVAYQGHRTITYYSASQDDIERLRSLIENNYDTFANRINKSGEWLRIALNENRFAKRIDLEELIKLIKK